MATIFKNPNLPDYFIDRPDIRAGQASSILESYEDAKVILLSGFKLDIDHQFWANLPTDDYPGLKKTVAQDDGGRTLKGSLAKESVPPEIAERLMAHAQNLLDQVRPVYESLFSGYRYT